MNRIVGIYKPLGITSHDVIDRVRSVTGEKKVGHAGTLDPLATGVLVVGIGREATKKLGQVVKKEKEYLALVRLGMTSSTDDEEGEKKEAFKIQIPNHKQIEEILKIFVGEIEQTPPLYSAVKVNGKAAYKRARKGEKFSLKMRKVEIKEIKVIDYKWPELKLCVVTGPGVYIRSLARDIGEKLGVGGYLKNLERVRVGEFRKDNAIQMEDFGKLKGV